MLDVSSDESDSETGRIRRAATLQLGQTDDDLPERSSRPVLTAAERAEIATWPDSHPREDTFDFSQVSTPEIATPASAAALVPEQKAMMTAVKAQPPKPPATIPAHDLEIEEMQKKYADLQAQLALVQAALQKKENQSIPCHSPPVQKPVFTPEASSTSIPKMAPATRTPAERLPKAVAAVPLAAGKAPEPKAAASSPVSTPASIPARSIEVSTPPPVAAAAHPPPTPPTAPASTPSAPGSLGAGAVELSEKELDEFYSLDSEDGIVSEEKVFPIIVF